MWFQFCGYRPETSSRNGTTALLPNPPQPPEHQLSPLASSLLSPSRVIGTASSCITSASKWIINTWQPLPEQLAPVQALDRFTTAGKGSSSCWCHLLTCHVKLKKILGRTTTCSHRFSFLPWSVFYASHLSVWSFHILFWVVFNICWKWNNIWDEGFASLYELAPCKLYADLFHLDMCRLNWFVCPFLSTFHCFSAM